ncbi:PQQ-dependent sugar dehydrogenase [Streptomyces sp. B6B3]|uniref:PQQ-dependent sugar dehydrogenase n=1 Tax=Streptomyces sp. B6B3 TaxID=3153570 RepID=UPI00325F3C2A
MHRRLLAAGAMLAAIAIAVTIGGTAPAAGSEDDPRPLAGFDFTTPEQIAQVDQPWGVAFLPDGSALVTERNTGRLLRIDPGSPPVEIMTLPSYAEGESGALGLVTSPTYDQDGYIYAYFTTEEDNRIVRFTLDDLTLEPILTGIPSNWTHNGGQLAFGPDGMLYASTGETGQPALAQDLDTLAGKILRLTPDGEVPADNPFPGSYVYTYGNRHVQGLAWDSTGTLYFSEIGQNTWDELNVAVPGRNYGWPLVEGPGGEPEYIDPIVYWPPADGVVSGITIVDDVLYGAALRSQQLWVIPVYDGEAGEPVSELKGVHGRLRFARLAPDGSLWIGTSRGINQVPSEDEIIRYQPLAAH